jgi:hypothetical protein
MEFFNSRKPDKRAYRKAGRDVRRVNHSQDAEMILTLSFCWVAPSLRVWVLQAWGSAFRKPLVARCPFQLLSVDRLTHSILSTFPHISTVASNRSIPAQLHAARSLAPAFQPHPSESLLSLTARSRVSPDRLGVALHLALLLHSLDLLFQ